MPNIDYRDLNAVTEKYYYPLPLVPLSIKLVRVTPEREMTGRSHSSPTKTNKKMVMPYGLMLH